MGGERGGGGKGGGAGKKEVRLDRDLGGMWVLGKRRGRTREGKKEVDKRKSVCDCVCEGLVNPPTPSWDPLPGTPLSLTTPERRVSKNQRQRGWVGRGGGEPGGREANRTETWVGWRGAERGAGGRWEGEE